MNTEQIRLLAEDFVSDLSTDAIHITAYVQQDEVHDNDILDLRAKDIRIQFEYYIKSFVTPLIQEAEKRGMDKGKLEGMKHIAFLINSEVEECLRQEELLDVTKIKAYVEPEILKILNS